MEIDKFKMANAEYAISQIAPKVQNISDRLKSAVEHSNYIATFPEDMIEDRTSWDTLYSMMDDYKSAFETLLDILSSFGLETQCEAKKANRR